MEVVSEISDVQFPVHSYLLRMYTGLFSSVVEYTNEHPKEVKVPFSERAITRFLRFLYDPLSGKSLHIEYEPECMEMADYLDCMYFIRFAEGAIEKKVKHLPYGLVKTWLNLAEKRDLKSLRAACIERLQIVLSEYLCDHVTMMTLVLDILASVPSKTTAREIIGISEFSPLWTSFAMTTVPEYPTLPENHIMYIMTGWSRVLETEHLTNDDSFQFEACGIKFELVTTWNETEFFTRLFIHYDEGVKRDEYMGKRFRVTIGLYDFVNRCVDRESKTMSCTYEKFQEFENEEGSRDTLIVDDMIGEESPQPHGWWTTNKEFFVHNLNSHGDPGVIVCVENIV